MFVIPQVWKQFLADTCMKKNTFTLDNHFICPNCLNSVDKFSSQELYNTLISSKSYIPFSQSCYDNEIDEVTLA